MHAIFSHFLTGCVIWPPPNDREGSYGILYGGVYLSKFPIFFKKHSLQGGLFGHLGGHKYTPWDFWIGPMCTFGGYNWSFHIQQHKSTISTSTLLHADTFWYQHLSKCYPHNNQKKRTRWKATRTWRKGCRKDDNMKKTQCGIRLQESVCPTEAQMLLLPQPLSDSRRRRSLRWKWRINLRSTSWRMTTTTRTVHSGIRSQEFACLLIGGEDRETNNVQNRAVHQ